MDPRGADVARRPPVVVLTGVSGSGKSTVGRALAARLDVPFQEGDDLHPPDNVARMRAGVPLSDADRWPWLDRVDAWITDRLGAGGGGVVSCSALRRAYRARLVREGVVVVLLDVDPDALRARLGSRTGHYMPAALLGSQLETLERPGPDEDVVVVEAEGDVGTVVDRVLADVRVADG